MIRGLISLIIQDATCQSEIGQTGSTYKVFPVVCEQDVAKPYVLLRRVPGTSIIVKGQSSDADSHIVKIAAYAETYKKCVDILSAVRGAIDNQRGTVGEVRFDRICYQFSEDLFDKDDNSFVVVDTYLAIELR